MSDFYLYDHTVEHLPPENDLGDYHVEATDGHVGTVMESSEEPGESYLVVNTGRWIGARRVMLPAGMVKSIDHEHRRVFVDATREQIRQAPQFDERSYKHTHYRQALERHYTGA